MPNRQDPLGTLRALTDQLQVLTDPSRPWIEYETKRGVCFGHAVYFRPEVAVQIAYASEHTQLPRHTHEEAEIIVVYEGECDLYLGEGECAECVRLHAGECYRIPPGTVHVFDCSNLCRMVAVTVPASPRYPHIPTT
jgi:quercetin dioxygenase-like cupin family protein